MLTSKERAALRAQANTLQSTLIVGKEGLTEQLLAEAANQLSTKELVKAHVLESALLTAREASDALCLALGAQGVQCIGSKFVLYKKSEKPQSEQARKQEKKAVNPVRRGAQERRRRAREEREKRNEYFRQSAIQEAIERRKK